MYEYSVYTNAQENLNAKPLPKRISLAEIHLNGILTAIKLNSDR